MVQEASHQVFTTLFSLCQHAGELALASNVAMTSLHGSGGGESDAESSFGQVGVLVDFFCDIF